MTITAEELKALDKAATQGEFGLSDCGNHIFSTDGECIAENGMPDNLEFIVSAVNGVRDGSLVHVDEVEKLRDALEWYDENASLCRLVHFGGDVGRAALADDGGRRARAALGDSHE